MSFSSYLEGRHLAAKERFLAGKGENKQMGALTLFDWLGTVDSILETINKLEDWAEKEGLFLRIHAEIEGKGENGIGLCHLKVEGIPDGRSAELQRLLQR